MTDKQLNKAEKSKHQYFYIKKYGNYYRPGSCGYTEYLHKAGIFKKEEALKIGKLCRDLDLVPIDVVKHNDILNTEIQELLTRYIFTTPL